MNKEKILNGVSQYFLFVNTGRKLEFVLYERDNEFKSFFFFFWSKWKRDVGQYMIL